ncbi:pyridoxamine 5'-phosphate oxidase family protein [Streptomyces sp. ZYX-F-203]
MYRNDGFRELDRRESLCLLATATVGRVVYTSQALPAIQPVAFELDGDGAVLLRASAHSDVPDAVDGAVVAFEADEVDLLAHTGWSVVVTGPASVLRAAGGPRRAGRGGPAEGDRRSPSVLVRVEPDLVAGRMLVARRGPHGSAPLDSASPPDVSAGRRCLG